MNTHTYKERKELIFPETVWRSQERRRGEGVKEERDIVCEWPAAPLRLWKREEKRGRGETIFFGRTLLPKREEETEREKRDEGGMQARREIWGEEGGRGRRRYKLGQFQACVMTPLFLFSLSSCEINNLGGGKREASGTAVHPPPILLAQQPTHSSPFPALICGYKKLSLGAAVGGEALSPPSAKSPNCRVFGRAEGRTGAPPLLFLSSRSYLHKEESRLLLLSSWHYHWGVLPMVFFPLPPPALMRGYEPKSNGRGGGEEGKEKRGASSSSFFVEAWEEGRKEGRSGGLSRQRTNEASSSFLTPTFGVHHSLLPPFPLFPPHSSK